MPETGSAALDLPLWLGSMILGVVQGVTEFLPISSSGHLVLLQHVINIPGDDLAFDLLLHLGTLLPVLIVFRDDLLQMLRDPFLGTGPLLQRPGVRWILLVGIASVPTALMGVLLEDLFETMFSGLSSLSWQFLITALSLQFAEVRGEGTRDIEDITWRDALIIGVAQGFAILPAISRSGSTIVAASLLGFKRDLAGRFSFVISIPAIGGAVLLKLRHLHLDPTTLPSFGLGTAASFAVGWVSLIFLVRVIKAGRFKFFAPYCYGMAALCLGLGVLWG